MQLVISSLVQIAWLMKTLLMLQILMLIPTLSHGGLSPIGTRLQSRKLGLTLLLLPHRCRRLMHLGHGFEGVPDVVASVDVASFAASDPHCALRHACRGV